MCRTDTHGASSVDKAVKATTLCFQWEKENNSIMVLWRNYPSIIKQFHNTACTLQWCVTVKLCRYHANRAPKTGDHQAHNPAATNGTTSRRNENSRYRQRRKSRQLEDPLLSMRKGNEYYNDMAEKLSKHKKQSYKDIMYIPKMYVSQ